MSLPVGPDAQGTSTRPYLIRALHEWCSDNGYTPYLAVAVDASVRVPMEYVKNGEIVLNVAFDATKGLRLGNEFIEFSARFSGTAREIVVPIDHVIAIYARENGQGMAFPMPSETADEPETEEAAPAASNVTGLRLAGTPAPEDQTEAGSSEDGDGDEPTPQPPSGRPSLKRIK